jgi:hypothetical protein
MRYQIRRVGPHDTTPYRIHRWVVHRAGAPMDVFGYAMLRCSARRYARHLARAEERAATSYRV